MDFPFVYDDEDNAPLNIEPHKPVITDMRVNRNGEWVTVAQYDSISDAVKAYRNRKDPDEPEKPANGCWNCRNFDWKHEACTINWNNMDESYYRPECDDRDPTDYCDDFDLDPEVKPEDWDFGGNEP